MKGRDNGRRIRKQSSYLGSGQLSEHSQATRRRHSRQPNSNISDQHWSANRSLLDQIEHVASVQHRKVRVLLHPVYQLPHDRPGNAL